MPYQFRRFGSLWVFLVLLAFAPYGIADDEPGGSCLRSFFVSGVLSVTGDEQTIKLIHSVVPANSKNEALQIFVKSALKQYPGYKMASVLASSESGSICLRSWTSI